MSGVSDEMSQDVSVSDVFAQGLIAEVGKSFVPERQVSEVFDDYEGARNALGTFLKWGLGCITSPS